MTSAATQPTQEEARAAVVAAVDAITALRLSAIDSLPEQSRGRAEIVAACDEALSAVGTAVRGDAVGDDRRSLWQRALELGSRAVERARRTVEEVKRATIQRLRRIWGVGAEIAETAKRKVKELLAIAVEAAKEKLKIAAGIVAALFGGSALVMFSGWVILAAAIVLYYSTKGSD